MGGKFDGYQSLNVHSIGIELVNAGELQLKDGIWRSKARSNHPEANVLKAKHKFGDEEKGWEKFTDIQLGVAAKISSLLFEHYSLIDILGHDDYLPRNKWDPGPAFPMEAFRRSVMGERADAPVVGSLVTSQELMDTPDSKSFTKTGNKIPAESKVEIISRGINYIKVRIPPESEGAAGIHWLDSKRKYKKNIYLDFLME